MFAAVIKFVNDNFRIVNPTIVLISCCVFFILERRYPMYLPIKKFFLQRQTNIKLGLIFTLTIFGTGYINFLAYKFSMTTGVGMFHKILILKQMDDWIKVIISFVVIDLMHFVAHLLLHKSDFLWRFHAVHHADGHLDVSTGFRFHPGDALFTNVVVATTIFILGLNFTGAILYGIIETIFILFIHSNLKTENSTWKILQLWIATPYLQAIHHSQIEADQKSNFGIVFSFWDRLFKTMRVDSIGQHKIHLGVDKISHKQARDFTNMFMYPFVKTKN